MVIELEKEISRIATGVIYLLYKRAVVNFPGTKRSHPSHKVNIQRSSNSPLRDGDKKIFPFNVVWFIWDSSVYPVIESLWGRDLTQIGDYDDQIAYVSGLLKNKLMEQGYWPKDSSFESFDFTDSNEKPGLFGNMKWLRLNFKLPEDKL